jgi:hypothetical protein
MVVKLESVSIRRQKTIKYIIYLFLLIFHDYPRFYIHSRWQMPMTYRFFCVGVIYDFVIVLSQPNNVPTNIHFVFCYHMNIVILTCTCSLFL